jgi:aspartyl-tRNA(Asn)/glutamyl-tRNA(Gln) amidotransferase subunit B
LEGTTVTAVEQDTRYEAVIGLEVHVELSTRTKMFCGCATDFGGQPNTRTCPVCLGQPGSLPVTNARAVEYAIKLGLALQCEVEPTSQFHRKNYFYPDMPKNYQISQYDVPICTGGHLDVETPEGVHRVGITRVHMEEDTGKSLHVGATGRIHGADYSLVDYNRAGIPLLEVVSEPDIRSSTEARAYLTELQAIVLALGISDAKLEEGSMRCDANISVRPAGETAFGTRVEVKNMNSVRSLGRAIEYEISRQIGLLEAGEPVVQETRHWDEDAGRTSTLRVKETTEDYRYFPDPDLVVLEPDPAWVAELRAALPELPALTRRRLAETYQLTSEQVSTLLEGGLVEVLVDAVAAGARAGEAANWLVNDVTSWRNEHGSAALTGAQLAELIALVRDGTLSTKLARQVLTDVLEGHGDPGNVARRRGFQQISDEGELSRIIDQVIASQADVAERVRQGNTKAVGALVGAVMRASQGKANPQLVNRLLSERLGIS